MLLTFPTKESMLRNLEEMNSEDVFLVIANFKTFKDWNLVPLRSLTAILGPNSAGKSSIHEVIKIIYSFSDRKFDDSYYDKESREEDITSIGFSMPFFINGFDIDDIRTICNLLFERFNVEDDLGFTYHHPIINGLIDYSRNNWGWEHGRKEGYLFSSIKGRRYTLIAQSDKYEEEHSLYEVYLENNLLSRRFADLSDEYLEIEVTSYAEEVLILPFLGSLQTHEDKSKYFFDLSKINKKENGKILSRLFYNYTKNHSSQNKNNTFTKDLPFYILSGETTHSDYSDDVGFGLVIALYYVCYHQFIDLVSGLASEDLRMIDSEWRPIMTKTMGAVMPSQIDCLLSNEIHKRIISSTYVHDGALSDEKMPFGIPYSSTNKPHILTLINRWLNEPAFLNSRYRLSVDTRILLDTEIFNFSMKDIEISIIDVEDFRLPVKKNITEITLKGVATDSPDIIFHGRVLIHDNNGRALAFDEVGTGYSQVIPILIGLASGEMLVFKQPELHLHPRLQSRVADCFVETVFNERSKRQSTVRIIETHSEHFILRLLRRLRESSMDELLHSSLTLYPDDVAFVYLQPQKDGSTQIHHIEVLPTGEFVEGWPDGFFDERDEDLWGAPSPRGR